MKKQKFNYLIDLLMLLAMLAIASIGFVIKYVLVSGSRRWEIYENNMEQTFWGMDRHDWGDVHLVLGIVLMALLILHIILHFNWVICMTKKAISQKPLRYIIVSLALLIILFCAAFPFIIKYNIQTGIHKEYHTRELKADEKLEQSLGTLKEKTEEQQKKIKTPANQIHQPPGKETRKINEEKAWEDIDIKGYMTFFEIETEFSIPSEILINKLGLPPNTPKNERLGRIKKNRNFTMEEIKLIVYNYQNENQ